MTGKDAIEKIIDFPKVTTNSKGNVVRSRNKSRPNEKAWTKWLLTKVNYWAPLAKMPPFYRYDVEYRLASEGSIGAPRLDVIFWHDETTVSILEAKTTSSPSELMGGVGQLLYYAAATHAIKNVRIKSLILAAPYLPPFILESIEISQAPVSFVKANEDGCNVLVPDFSRAERWSGWA